MSVNSEMARLSTAKHDILVSLETLGADVQLDDSLDDVCRLLANIARSNIDTSTLIDRSIGNITLPSSLTSIGTYAFYNCTNLALTSLPSSLTSIRSSAFRNCTKLALTSLPSGVTSIGDYAFRDCTKLALTSLPSSLTSIGTHAFAYCRSLTGVTFQGTPTSISTSAFQYSNNLTIINVPWASGAVAGAPWGATKATINYNYV